MYLALSCSWNSHRHTNAKDIIDEIKRLGFNRVELDFSLTADIVEDIGKLVDSGQIEVVSVHNFCPIPEGMGLKKALPDCYSMASQDEGVRAEAIKNSKVTINTAARLKAEAAILHCGRVELDNKTLKLKELYRQNLKGSLHYEEVKREAIKERSDKCKPYFEAALKSIKEISAYAKIKGVKLGIENRAYFHEIPSFEELGIIFSQTDKDCVFYWHDTGHAQLLENLSFGAHIDYLKAYGRRLLGVHLHDIEGTDDHKAPPKGGVNFKKLKPYIKNDTLKVIEAHHPATNEEIIEAKNFLEGIYG